MEEKQTSDVFSVETCHRLLQEHRERRTEESLKAIISEVAKLDPVQACEPYMQDMMLELLITFNNTRNDAVDERLVCFLKEIEWFRKTFESEDLSIRKFIKNFEVIRVDKFTKIVRRGQQSDYFYLLIKGKASVLKEREVVLEGPEKIEMVSPPARRQCSFIEREPNPLYWQEVKELNDGESFGQIGIIYKRRRLLTIVTKTKASLIRIPADTYIQISAEGTLKQHQRRLKFVCERLSTRVRNLSYEELQQTLFEFEPVTFPYGAVMFKSHNFEHFLIIEEGNAMVCHLQGKSTIVRRQLLTQGRFIGLKELLREVDPDRLPRFSRLSETQRKKQTASCSYHVVAASAEVHTYKVPCIFFMNLLRNHRQILADILQRREYQLDILEREVKTVNRQDICKTESDRHSCKISEEYQKMSNFIIRKRLEFKNREKQNFKISL